MRKRTLLSLAPIVDLVLEEEHSRWESNNREAPSVSLKVYSLASPKVDHDFALVRRNIKKLANDTLNSLHSKPVTTANRWRACLLLLDKVT